ncbi:hypothetical protein [Streptomyces sp. NBC_00140]|uniref:hypothetical protein n=1 Tax=Streptomyces sp. NBC_00140 TaxID=2975664 RepID=UPI00224D56B2|nr:hypothetical protein [Streptomyces sp. NBC_00140]MCX5327792.1 hypothetical protein [Streptomyces sp. NBC_00140]MCX5336841.1 hypothetical protein [Streptomyces sp. NBC_00140]
MPTTASSSSPSARSRRPAAVASVLTVITVAAAVVALVGANLSESWWPRTGVAFTPEPSTSSTPRAHPCEVIVGPAKKYCERGTTTSGLASGEQHDVADAAFRLVPVGAGLGALVIWRRRRSLARGRG